MKKKWIIIIVTIVILAISVCTIINQNNNNNELSELLTLKEAAELSISEAKKWAEDATLVYITSVDTSDSNYESGSDGTRRAWTCFLESKIKNSSYLVGIYDGKVTKSEEDGGEGTSTRPPIDINSIVDSPEALNIAKKKGLQASGKKQDEWIKGYDYMLRYAELSNDLDTSYLAILVYGISPNGNFAHVVIDATTGDILNASEETSYDKDGHSIWEDF